jgi:hypothetical protein
MLHDLKAAKKVDFRGLGMEFPSLQGRRKSGQGIAFARLIEVGRASRANLLLSN